MFVVHVIFFSLKTLYVAEWIMEYNQSRPGLKVLEQNIDEFITAHEAKLEQVFSFAVTLSVILNLIVNHNLNNIFFSFNVAKFMLRQQVATCCAMSSIYIYIYMEAFNVAPCH